MMNYEIETRAIEPVRIAFLRYQGPVAEAGKVFPGVFQAVRGKTNGAPFFSYIEMNPHTRTGQLELCVPTAENPAGSGIEVKELPRIRAVCTTHTGSYDTLAEAYGAIDRYAAEHKLRLTPPFREVFIKGPGMLFKGNPRTYVTEIQFPILEDQSECD